MTRRPSRQQIAQALLNLELLWRPPDKKNAPAGTVASYEQKPESELCMTSPSGKAAAMNAIEILGSRGSRISR